MVKAKKFLILQRPLKNRYRKNFQTILKIGFTLLVAYVIYNIGSWKEHWDYERQDQLILQQKLDPITEQIGDVMTLDDWAKPMHCDKSDGKKTRIALLKTHKTGGTTVASILNRFTDIYHLDIAIPVNDNRFNWPAPFSHQYVQIARLKDKKTDVLNHHCVFNRREISKIMKPGFRLITIIREPVSQFYSMFHYLRIPKHYHLQNESDPVEVFIKNPNKYHHYKPYVSVGREKYFEENLLHNGNLYDLNFERFQEKGAPGSRGLQPFISYLEKAFHLVLITERFDEGLLLLKKLMCWDFMDIVYEKRLVNPKLHNESFHIPEEVGMGIRAWNKEDAILYQHFENRFEQIVALQDQITFQKDLFNFRQLNSAVLEFCSNMMNVSNTDGGLGKEKFNNVTRVLKEMGEDPPPQFLVKPHCFCNKLHRSEREYINFFAKRFPPYYFIKSLATARKMNDC